jgi:hypothetical protein
MYILQLGLGINATCIINFFHDFIYGIVISYGNGEWIDTFDTDMFLIQIWFLYIITYMSLPFSKGHCFTTAGFAQERDLVCWRKFHNKVGNAMFLISTKGISGTLEHHSFILQRVK